MNHHAYFAAGEEEEGIQNALSFGERELSLTAPNPDIVMLSFPLLSVLDARRIGELVSQTSAGGTKLVIISAQRLFHEAQNALLKVFEEPPTGTYLVLVIPHEDILLPTLRSRLIPLPVEEGRSSKNAKKHSVSSPAEEFISGTKALREKLVAKLLDKAKSDKPEEKQQARTDILSFVEELTRKAHAASLKNSDEELMAFLEDANRLVPILYERSAPLKPILEHILLTFPKNI